MTLTRADIEGLVVRIQGEFLLVPGLQLSLAQATSRFGLPTGVCEAILRTLVEARVLARAAGGDYRRHVPQARAA